MNKRKLKEQLAIYEKIEELEKQFDQLIGWRTITGRLYIENLFTKQIVQLTQKGQEELYDLVKKDLKKQIDFYKSKVE